MFEFSPSSAKKSLALAALIAVGIAAAPHQAAANPDPTAGLYNPTTYTFTAAGTTLSAYFLGKAVAADTDYLQVFDNANLLTDTAGQSSVLVNQTTTPGTGVTYSGINPGDVLTFAVLNTTVGATVYSNPIYNAPYDSKSGVTPVSTALENHVYSTAYSGSATAGAAFPTTASAIPAGTYVGFEDTPFPGVENASGTYYNYTDYSYDDEAFVFTSTNMVTNVPEPGTLSLLGFGLAGLGMLYTRRRQANGGIA